MSDAVRLKRLRLLTRLREIEHRAAAADLYTEIGRERRARELADRTGALVAGYAARKDAANGHELAAQAALARQVRTVHRDANAHASEAGRLADRQRLLEVAARQRRDRAKEFADDFAKTLLQAQSARDVAARVAVGTVLDEMP